MYLESENRRSSLLGSVGCMWLSVLQVAEVELRSARESLGRRGKKQECTSEFYLGEIMAQMDHLLSLIHVRDHVRSSMLDKKLN